MPRDNREARFFNWRDTNLLGGTGQGMAVGAGCHLLMIVIGGMPFSWPILLGCLIIFGIHGRCRRVDQRNQAIEIEREEEQQGLAVAEFLQYERDQAARNQTGEPQASAVLNRPLNLPVPSAPPPEPVVVAPPGGLQIEEEDQSSTVLPSNSHALVSQQLSASQGMLQQRQGGCRTTEAIFRANGTQTISVTDTIGGGAITSQTIVHTNHSCVSLTINNRTGSVVVETPSQFGVQRLALI